MPNPIFSKKLSFIASLSTTALSLSLLAGCAGSPDQEQFDETPDAQAEVQVEVNDSVAPEENVNTDAATPQVATTEPKVESEEVLTAEASSDTVEAESSITNEQIEPATSNSTQATELPVEGDVTTNALVSTEASSNQNPGSPAARSTNNIGKSYGIWTLKETDNGRCKLSTSTLQISTSNNEYSSQIWMDIEEQRIVVNAFMPMEITHPNTGIQIDNQALIPFTEKLYSTRAVVNGDLTSELAQGKELHIFINGKEVGKQVLRRDVALTNMNSGINALQSCGK